jgi:hypothetical protein
MPDGTTLNDIGSTYTEIAAMKGSVLFCKSCTASFTGSYLKDVLARNGGSIYLLDAVTVTLDAVKMYNGKSIGGDGGAIYVTVSDPLNPVTGSLTFANCGAM